MRFQVKLLNTGATVNDFHSVSQATIFQGEDIGLLFQLVDAEKSGLRYLPPALSTLYVEIARFPEVFGSITNVRSTVDYSIRQYASQPFATDLSIWKLPLSASQTSKIMSSSIRFTLTEGGTSEKRIYVLPMAIIVNPSEGA